MKQYVYMWLSLVLLSSTAWSEVRVWIEPDGSLMMEATDGDTLPVGVALELDANDGGDGGQITGFISDNSVYNVNIDHVYDNRDLYVSEADLGQGTKVANIDGPGVATLPADAIVISTGILGADPGTGPLSLGTVELSDNDVCLSLNDLRGGLVAADSTQVSPVFVGGLGACGADGVLYPGIDCPCLGDISGPLGVPDGIVSTSDLAALIECLSKAGPPFIIDPIPDDKICMDVAGPAAPGPDGILSTSDLSVFILYLSSLGPPFQGPCIP